MGVTAENVASQYKISREEQDEFAINSQKKANDAINNNKFKNEIVPLKININLRRSSTIGWLPWLDKSIMLRR